MLYWAIPATFTYVHAFYNAIKQINDDDDDDDDDDDNDVRYVVFTDEVV